MPAKKQRMFVYEASDGQLRTQPPAVQLDFADADGPEQFVLKNNTTEGLMVYVDDGALTGGTVAQLLPTKAKIVLAVDSQGVGSIKSYKLQIFGTVSGKKAQGNSDPVIIIEN